MMKKTTCKRILGLFFVIMAILVIPKSAMALDRCEAFKKEIKSTLVDRYGVSVSYDADADLITISMNPSSQVANIKNNLKFKLTTVSEENNDRSFPVSNGSLNSYFVSSNELTINHPIVLRNILPGFVNYNFTIEPDGYIDPIFQENCPDAYLIEYQIKLSLQIGGKAKTIPIDIPDEDPGDDSITIPASFVDCSNYKTTTQVGSFAYNFCYAKEHASKSYTFDSAHSSYTKLKGTGKSESFVCDAFVETTRESGVYTEANTKYLYGSITNTIKGDEYEYVYHYGCNTKRVPVSCTTSCEEAVTVEYDAPVASNAGLCFSYTVRVTSRVNCTGGEAPPQPTKPASICTPTPQCVHAEGWVHTQAGPSEDFDACIYSCDGGKYTTKCSTKCYKQVYGVSSSIKSGSNALVDFANVAEQIANYDVKETDLSKKGQGKYVCNKDTKVITWSPDNIMARWYLENEWHWRDDYKCVKDASQGGGIVSLCRCDASCSWIGCKGEVYINKEEAEADYKKNMEVYRSIKSKCAAAASCNTTQATFDMNINYSYEKNHKTYETTIYFPYNGQSDTKDTIEYGKPTKGSVDCSSERIRNTTIISSDGCYTCGDGSLDLTKFGQNYYQTKWGFPGTWISNKSNIISYEPIEESSFVNHSFCMPFNAVDVNSRWWIYYYARAYGNDERFAFNDEEYLSKVPTCNGSTTKEDVTCTYADVPEKFTGSIDYNIHAKTTEFGYFGWNIDISCFYALNRNTVDVCGNKCIDTKGEKRYKVHAIDLSNPFPSPDGSVLTDPSTTGSSAGFNCSEHANNVMKDPDYTSQPGRYFKWVQGTAYNVYSPEYVDYRVYLTRQKIKQLRASKHKYTDFNGEYVVDSVVNYKSPLFRNGGLLSDSQHPNDEALKCNNMVNWQSSECQTFDDVGEE